MNKSICAAFVLKQQTKQNPIMSEEWLF